MNKIENLNKKYVEESKRLQILSSYHKKIKEQSNSNRPIDERIAQVSSYYSDITKQAGNLKPVIADAFSIADCYCESSKLVDAYKDSLLDKGKNNKKVADAVKQLKSANDKYASKRDGFREKTGLDVSSNEKLIRVIASCINDEIMALEGSLESIREEAREVLKREISVKLRYDDKVCNDDVLPLSFLVAQRSSDTNRVQILKDIGLSSNNENYLIDLKKQGNVLIECPQAQMEDEKLDNFIISYILRYISEYPLGSLNVHIFDQNTSFLYKRLCNEFQSENAGERVKNTVQIHSSYQDLTNFRDVICEDIFNKTSHDKPDLYSIYESDRSDPFNLIILRDGLLDGSGYSSSEYLEIIDYLTKPGNTGHKCGLL